MKIIGYGKKDYYDYLSGIYGEDPVIVYDRKDSVVLDPESPEFRIQQWFNEKPIIGDIKKQSPKHRYGFDSVYARMKFYEHSKPWNYRYKIISWKKLYGYKEGRIFHFILEIGNYCYLIELERYLDEDDKDVVHLEPRILNRFEGKKKSDAPISLYECTCRFPDDYKVEKIHFNNRIDNPILGKTWIRKIISAEDIWKSVYEYLGTLKDKPIIDSRTNEEHIESNGFDKKISFRNIK